MPRAGRFARAGDGPCRGALGPPRSRPRRRGPRARSRRSGSTTRTPNVGPRIPEASMTVVNGDHVPVAARCTSASKSRADHPARVDGRGIRRLHRGGPRLGAGSDVGLRAPPSTTRFSTAATTARVILTHCRLDASGNENVWTDGVRGNNFTMRYCEVWRTVDGFGGSSGAYYGPTVIENCRFGNAYYTAWWNTAAARRTPRPRSRPRPATGAATTTARRSRAGPGTRSAAATSAAVEPRITSRGQAESLRLPPPATSRTLRRSTRRETSANSGMMIQNNIGAAAAVGASSRTTG